MIDRLFLQNSDVAHDPRWSGYAYCRYDEVLQKKQCGQRCGTGSRAGQGAE